MISRFLVPLFLCLFAVTGFAAEPPFDRALLGTWEFQLSGSLSSFTGYTTFRPDGTCVQIGRGKTLGMTKWIYVETLAPRGRAGRGISNALKHWLTDREVDHLSDYPTYHLRVHLSRGRRQRGPYGAPDPSSATGVSSQLAELQQKATGK